MDREAIGEAQRHEARRLLAEVAVELTDRLGRPVTPWGSGAARGRSVGGRSDYPTHSALTATSALAADSGSRVRLAAETHGRAVAALPHTGRGSTRYLVHILAVDANVMQCHESRVVRGVGRTQEPRPRAAPATGALEIPCYTDRFDISVDRSEGPYTIVSTVEDTEAWDRVYGSARLGLIVRIEQHLPRSSEYYVDLTWDQNERDVSHGGDAGQELAALISLLLGIRLRAAGISRSFDFGSDNLFGDLHDPGAAPYIPPATSPPMLPYLAHAGRAVEVERLSLLGSYAKLSMRQSRALVRAARSYQEAVWIANTDPRQAWLRLVTAAEAIAQFIQDDPPLARLRRLHPDIADWVASINDQTLASHVTELLVDHQKVSAKFLKFFDEFKPPPPKRRPMQGDRMKWTGLPHYLKAVYAARSKDLHVGTPIPQAMCRPPLVSERARIASEVIWRASTLECPLTMSLQMFEYLVRGSVINWWIAISSHSHT